MFSENLSNALLRIINEQNLSYEALAERCNVSSRFIGNIVRKKSSPTLITLEKLCAGLGKTPNELLLKSEIQTQSFRSPMPVTQIGLFPQDGTYVRIPICPRCSCVLDNKYRPFCSQCGQALNWQKFIYAKETVLTK